MGANSTNLSFPTIILTMIRHSTEYTVDLENAFELDDAPERDSNREILPKVYGAIPASPRAHRASSATPRLSPRSLPSSPRPRSHTSSPRPRGFTSGPKATRGSDKPQTPRKDPKSFSETRKIESDSLLDLGNRCRKASQILTMTPGAQAAPRKLIASAKPEEFQQRKKRKTDW